MQTQPPAAVGSEPPVDAKAAATQAFEDIATEMLPPEEEELPVEDEGEEPEATEVELEIEEEADDLPPIDAPVSWDAEAKAKFAELPRELQETVQQREAERERFVQQKSQEATRAKTDALQTATAELAQIERSYASQYQQVAEQIAVNRPHYSLLATDPVEFARQSELADAAEAQRQNAQLLAQQYAQQAQQREAQAEQAYHAEQHRIIVDRFPEYADPTTGPKLQQELSAVARELGYSPELISQARAEDILAMRTAAEWKAKAQKLDALNAAKMGKVRAAKGLPRVAKPGVSQGSDQLRASRASVGLETARTAKNRDVQGAGFYDYLKNTGQIT